MKVAGCDNEGGGRVGGARSRGWGDGSRRVRELVGRRKMTIRRGRRVRAFLMSAKIRQGGGATLPPFDWLTVTATT